MLKNFEIALEKSIEEQKQSNEAQSVINGVEKELKKQITSRFELDSNENKLNVFAKSINSGE